jgi:hypothetical protein
MSTKEHPEQNHAPKWPIGGALNGKFFGGHSVMVAVRRQRNTHTFPIAGKKEI